MAQIIKSHIRDYDRLAKHFDERLGLYARQTIDEALKNANLSGNEVILDACCGTGEMLLTIASREHTGSLIGIDFSTTMLNVAQRKLRGYQNVSLKHFDAKNIDFPKEYFDIVFNTNALHYFDDPKAVLREFARILKPHGRLILADLAANSRFTRFWSLVRSMFKPTYRHLYRFEEMNELLRSSGFTIISRKLWRVNIFWSVMIFDAQKLATKRH